MKKNEKQKKQKLLLGAHMSIAGGMYQAIVRGQEIDCTAIQVFTKSNRQWGSKPLIQEDIVRFKKTWEDSSIKSIIAHSTYLINLGSPKPEILKKSLSSLEDELKRCKQLGIGYLVLHPGSCLSSSEKDCIQQIADALDKVLGKTDGTVKILLETTAGQGTGVGYTFEQIAAIFEHAKQKRRLGVCLDTCHIFAAGYDFRTKKGYEQVINQFDKIIGLHRLKAIHVNDSMRDLGTRVDRHEDIGRGKIGLDGFKYLFNDERFFDIPKILETPEGTLESYAKNMRVIKNLLTSKTKKILGVN